MSATPYGAWRSPITADLIVAETIGLSQAKRVDGVLYWSESRPAEGGRNVIVSRDANGRIADVLPAPYSARTRAHEYGGGAYAVSDGVLYFANDADQRVYRVEAQQAPMAVTAPEACRYADFVIDQAGERLIAIMEDHRASGPPRNVIADIDVAGRRPVRILVEGNDFYAAPRLSGDGRRLAWITWNHPDMPWDATELWCAELSTEGALVRPRKIAGGARESVVQPLFAPDGSLYFVSDRTGWWNLYRWNGDGVRAIAPQAAEFGMPQWVFGQATYAFARPDCLAASYNVGGIWRLALINPETGAARTLELPYSDITSVQADSDHVSFIAAGATTLPAVVTLALANLRHEVVLGSANVCLEPGFLSRPRAIRFASADGHEAHGFYYTPRNHDVDSLPDAKPPLIVVSHGGPTTASTSALNLRIQFWTSRGFAVLDVNYRGSSGYGRAYRDSLYGQWGVADVEDCIAGARYLVAQGAVDGDRLAIRGGSAGGYTTLCALTFHHAFHAGASYYGVSDLEALAHDTHKFEAHYLDKLIGPYPAQQALYRARSPVHHADRLRRPVIFFQGLEDKVVPPDQTERMVAALRAAGVPVAYIAFVGEQHGFRQADNIKRSLEAELYFYGRLFGFTPADRVTPVDISNFT